MPVWRHLKPEQVGKGRERKKIKIFVPTQRVIDNSKKIAKKLKNTIMAPFQATIG